MNREWCVQAAYFLLRFVSGLLLLASGGTKMFGWFGGMPKGMTFELMSQTGAGATIEIVCGILIMLGLFTGPAAFLSSGTMAVAYWQFHAPPPASISPTANGGMPAVLLCFIFLYLAARGGGEWSLDRMLARRRDAGAVDS